MKALIMVAALCACTPRPWNFDETDRIGEVMGMGDEDPLAEATLRSTAAPELPDVLPYSQPVFVRPKEERSPSFRGKRATTAERAKGVLTVRGKGAAGTARGR